MRGFHERGAACPTVQILDPAHGAKNGSMQPLSMARLLLLGVWPVLCTQLVDVQRHYRKAGLHAACRVFRVTLGVDAKLRICWVVFQSAFRVKCKRPDVFSYYPPQLRLQPTLASVSQR